METDEVVFIVEEDKEVGGYSAVCHRHGIFTQGDNLDDLRANVAEAFECRFEGEAERPRQIRLHFIRDEVIAARSFRATSPAPNWSPRYDASVTASFDNAAATFIW